MNPQCLILIALGILSFIFAGCAYTPPAVPKLTYLVAYEIQTTPNSSKTRSVVLEWKAEPESKNIINDARDYIQREDPDAKDKTFIIIAVSKLEVSP